jgi:ribonuclease H2 subunit A
VNILKMDLDKYTENNGENYVLFSEIPEVCKNEPCILGIDEAGRGPVLGPMVYGISFCPLSKNSDLKDLGVDDSKALSEKNRDDLLEKLNANSDYIGWAITVLSARYISTSMYRRSKYNLNTMSHDTAIDLVKMALDKGVQVAEIYVDTVGPPEKYQAKLQEIFPMQKVTVAKKADSLYPCVSAASICAKVTNTVML